MPRKTAINLQHRWAAHYRNHKFDPDIDSTLETLETLWNSGYPLGIAERMALLAKTSHENFGGFGQLVETNIDSWYYNGPKGQYESLEKSFHLSASNTPGWATIKRPLSEEEVRQMGLDF